MITDPFCPNYSRTHCVSWVLQSSVSMSLKIHFWMPDSGGFPSHKNKIFLQVHTNIMTFPHWEKEIHQPVTNRKEQYRENKMCRLAITVRTETVKKEEYIKRKIFFKLYSIILC